MISKIVFDFEDEGGRDWTVLFSVVFCWRVGGTRSFSRGNIPENLGQCDPMKRSRRVCPLFTLSRVVSSPHVELWVAPVWVSSDTATLITGMTTSTSGATNSTSGMDEPTLWTFEHSLHHCEPLWPRARPHRTYTGHRSECPHMLFSWVLVATLMLASPLAPRPSWWMCCESVVPWERMRKKVNETDIRTPPWRLLMDKNSQPFPPRSLHPSHQT